MVITEMLQHFGNKALVLHEAQGFHPYAMSNTYGNKEQIFKRTIRVAPLTGIPECANFISSHTKYKVKIELPLA